ncbi:MULTISPECIES: hypothetical protein [unclassified Lentimonas]|uniref:hypothetical protein n=1 Tax=unclassified Lentimonas TaxID=2630993 RepID=UPI001389E96F|nr:MULTISPECIES: hypothetical protein [unclassified Lentimonas]
MSFHFRLGCLFAWLSPITTTSRISIDVTPGQHKRLKALAALSGQSIKDYVLGRTLLQSGEDSVEAVFDEVADELRG